MTNVCTTVVVLLIMITHCVQSVGVHVIPYRFSKSGKVWRVPGGSSTARVKPITAGLTACSVTGV